MKTAFQANENVTTGSILVLLGINILTQIMYWANIDIKVDSNMSYLLQQFSPPTLVLQKWSRTPWNLSIADLYVPNIPSCWVVVKIVDAK